MRLLSFILILIYITSCNNSNESIDIEIKDSLQKELSSEISQKDSLKDDFKIVEIDILKFFSQDIRDDEFQDFYFRLIEACQKKDTTVVLSLIADSLRFSKYECAYGQFYKSPNECLDCVRCSKKGMLEGIFPNLNSEQLCESLLIMITRYGVGPLSRNNMFFKWLQLDKAYVNFNFKNTKDCERYFDYALLLPVKGGIEIKESPTEESKIVDTLKNEVYEYSNEPGMGVWDDENEIMWYEFKNGYINSSDVITGFDYTLVIFEKTHLGWKISGFIQPPGC